MRYIAISEEDILTLKAAEIQQKRYEKMGVKSEVCALIPLERIGDYFDDVMTDEQLEQIKNVIKIKEGASIEAI